MNAINSIKFLTSFDNVQIVYPHSKCLLSSIINLKVPWWSLMSHSLKVPWLSHISTAYWIISCLNLDLIKRYEQCCNWSGIIVRLRISQINLISTCRNVDPKINVMKRTLINATSSVTFKITPLILCMKHQWSLNIWSKPQIYPLKNTSHKLLKSLGLTKREIKWKWEAEWKAHLIKFVV